VSESKYITLDILLQEAPDVHDPCAEVGLRKDKGA